MARPDSYDVIIVGGGIAGMSAALILGRCRRTVLICDSGKPRNRVSLSMHGFLSRDGVNPLELRQIGREQLIPYQTVMWKDVEVIDACWDDGVFKVTFAEGGSAKARYLLLATGIVDKLPLIAGIDSFYGRSVFHCPYCDGWEVRGQPLAAYGQKGTGVELALELLTWSDDVLLCTDGEPISADGSRRLSRKGIDVRTDRIDRLEGSDGILERIVFASGPSIHRRAIFFYPEQYQRSPLAESLGCSVTPGGMVETGKLQATRPGLLRRRRCSTVCSICRCCRSRGGRSGVRH